MVHAYLGFFELGVLVVEVSLPAPVEISSTLLARPVRALPLELEESIICQPARTDGPCTCTLHVRAYCVPCIISARPNPNICGCPSEYIRKKIRVYGYRRRTGGPASTQRAAHDQITSSGSGHRSYSYTAPNTNKDEPAAV